VPKSDQRPAVQVEVDGKAQQFVGCGIMLSGPILTHTVQSAEELSSMVLGKMRGTAEQYLNKKVK